jgi:hypothetical protein
MGELTTTARYVTRCDVTRPDVMCGLSHCSFGASAAEGKGSDMQAAPVPFTPGLAGTSASKAVRGMAIAFGAFLLVFVVPLTLLDAGASALDGRRGHLPWPLVQWAFTSLLGALVLRVLCLLVICPPLVLFSLRQRRREVARAVDVTGIPPWAWPGAWQLRSWRPWLQPWLGQGRGEQAVSLLLLILAMLLAVALGGIVIGSTVYGFAVNGAVQCDANGNGCPPNFFLPDIPVASLCAGMALAYVLRAQQLRRVEAASQVWLRYRDWVSMAPLCYIRHPGVTPEAAAAALAPFSTSLATPVARRFCVAVLVFIPYVVVVCASLVLSAWLQLQWRPG